MTAFLIFQAAFAHSHQGSLKTLNSGQGNWLAHPTLKRGRNG
ncbi:hypothetical protein [Kingella oralis]